MKKVLDIGCAKGYQILQDAMKHPDRWYVGIDIKPQIITTDSPNGVYNLLRDFAIGGAQHEHCKGKEEYADWQRELSSAISRDSSFRPQDRRYEENLEDSITILSGLEKGRKILTTKVGEALNPNSALNSLITISSPELYRMTVKEFLESNPPASFRDHVHQYTDRIHFLVADGRNLPFQDKVFDYSLADGVPVSEDFDMFVSEAMRVTKEGGKVLISWVPKELRQEYPDGIEIEI